MTESSPVFAYSILAFVIMTAIAMVVQAAVAVRTYRHFRELKEQVSPLVPQARAALEAAHATISESRTQIQEISTRAVSILDSVRNQMVKVEEVVVDATSRARNQLDRTEMIVEDTVSRVHETVSAVHGTILRPIREVNGLAAGVKAGIAQLIRGNRPSVDRATQDEEMFI